MPNIQWRVRSGVIVAGLAGGLGRILYKPMDSRQIFSYLLPSLLAFLSPFVMLGYDLT